MIYLDTSALFSFYVVRPNTDSVRVAISKREGPIVINNLVWLELESAICRMTKSKQITKAKADWLRTHLHSELRLENIIIEKLEWENVMATSFNIVHNSKHNCSTLDSLHIASCLVQDVKSFITCDKVQFKEAKSHIDDIVLAE